MIKIICILNSCLKSASLTADTLSLRSIALTDTSYITGTVHDTELACHLTIMNTSHIWVSSNYLKTWPLVILIYQQYLRTAMWIQKYCRFILYRFWPNRIDQKGAQFIKNHFIFYNVIMTSFWTTLNDAAEYLLIVK